MKNKLFILILLLVTVTAAGCERQAAALDETVPTPGDTDSLRSLPLAVDEHSLAGNDDRPADWKESQELEGNPFLTLLGVIRVPADLSVRPCSGEAPSLCVYQANTLQGSVELVTLSLARDVGLQKVLSDAGIALGSVDVTRPEYARQVREALAAHAKTYLALRVDLARNRSATDPQGYTFSPVAPEEVHIGRLPGLAYGFAGVDRDGYTVERWLTYAALDNDTLYLFDALYTAGMPGSFPSDEELLRFEPYLRQTLAGLRLPVSEDYHPPGAELLSTGPRIVVQRPDTSIQYVSADGAGAVLVADAPASLLPAGFDRLPMTDGPAVFIRQQWGDGFYVLDTLLGRLIPLDSVPAPISPVAVRPLSEEAVPEGQTVGVNWDISLAWGEFTAGYTATAGLVLSTQDGNRRLEALKETYGSSEPWTRFVPWHWRWRERQDDQLFFTKEPVDGMGGFFPFMGAANLWVYDLQRADSMELISDAVTGGKLCLDAISPDDQLLAHHCDGGQITLTDLETGQTTAISLPELMTGDAHLGSVRFSPDGSRIAFAVMTGGYGLVEETQGYIAVSDGLSGRSHIIATSEPGEWFSVAEWLWGDTLVLQSYNAGPYGWPAVWMVKADGNDLIKMTDGTYLAAY